MQNICQRSFFLPWDTFFDLLYCTFQKKLDASRARLGAENTSVSSYNIGETDVGGSGGYLMTSYVESEGRKRAMRLRQERGGTDASLLSLLVSDDQDAVM